MSRLIQVIAPHRMVPRIVGDNVLIVRQGQGRRFIGSEDSRAGSGAGQINGLVVGET